MTEHTLTITGDIPVPPHIALELAEAEIKHPRILRNGDLQFNIREPDANITSIIVDGNSDGGRQIRSAMRQFTGPGLKLQWKFVPDDNAQCETTVTLPQQG